MQYQKYHVALQDKIMVVLPDSGELFSFDSNLILVAAPLTITYLLAGVISFLISVYFVVGVENIRGFEVPNQFLCNIKYMAGEQKSIGDNIICSYCL